VTFDTTIKTRLSVGSSPHAGDKNPITKTNSEINRMIFLDRFVVINVHHSSRESATCHAA
jgi:hypothetical protein